MPSDRPDDLQLDRAKALVLLIDVQEKLARAMPAEAEARMEKNAAILIKAARRLGLPVVASEQYVKGLGPTVSGLRDLLPSPPIEKMEFSCANVSSLAGHYVVTNADWNGFAVLHSAFPDLRATVEDEIADGDKVVVRSTWRGTHQGEFQGIPATGKQVSFPVIDIVRFENGKAVEHWGLVDAMSLMQQLGAIPGPGGTSS